MKKIVAIFLAVLMIAALLAGCGTQTNDTPSTEGGEEQNISNRSYPFTFTDLAGTEITLEKQPETVYIVGSVQPLAAVYRYYAGTSAHMIQCPEASQKIIGTSVFGEIWPDMLTLDTHTDDANVEEVLALNPDVVFMTGSASGDQYEALTNAGLTVVSFPTASSSSGNSFDAIGTVADWLNQMATVFGDSVAADKMIEYNNSALRNIQDKLADVQEADMPKALIVFQLADNSLKVAGSGHYSEFWLKNTGAINAAAEIKGIGDVDIEQVMAWNPDIIYLTTFSPAMPDDFYNNTFDGFDWSQVAAVQDKQVYKIPLGSYRWYAPSCECALMLQWMASINHPELFNDFDMVAEVTSFIETFYGVTPTEEQVKTLLNPSDASVMSH